jgi:acetyltransferase
VRHALASLLAPRSVALVGASEKAGSLGRTVLENLIAGGFEGALHAINSTRRKVLGRPTHASIASIGETVDLAVIATPAATIPGILDATEGRLRSAAILSFVDGDDATARAWQRAVSAAASRHRIRLVGPGAFGVVRTDIHLNASFCAPSALPGRLALVSQSAAVCTAMLDFAGPLSIGFSTVISLGGGIDVGFGELLEALVHDPATDGILLYVESVGNARAFMSALRQAARTKPVVVLKAGRSQERAPEVDALREPAIGPDLVFDAALERAGTVRVRTYTQLFAAARILAAGRIPRGDRLAIVSNGHGPGVLAADHVRDCGVTLAQFAPETVRTLDALLPPAVSRANPIDVRGDASPVRFADAVSVVLRDDGVDAVLALHVPRPVIDAVDAAVAVADAARASSKPVLAAWLGAVNRPGVQRALEAGNVANFYTPENAVDAFAFLAAYRRNQQWLLEVPSPHPDPEPPDLAGSQSIREKAQAEGHILLPPAQAQRLLASFGIATAPAAVVTTLAQARMAARRLGYPVSLAPERARQTPAREGLANGRALERAWRDLIGKESDRKVRMVVRRSPPAGVGGACAIALATDPVFGPVIAVGGSVRGAAAPRDRVVMLPPLNRRLATDLITAAGIVPHEPLVHLLLQVSALTCALPWVCGLALDPVIVAEGRVALPDARVVVDPRRKPGPAYWHMAIHPYPVELEGWITLPDRTKLAVRPIRPEDAELERRFIAGLSETTRYFRFFYNLHELTPAMLGRFTQVDYDRELALLALAPDAEGPGGVAIAAIARYVANVDHESAEFAIVVADAWQGRGVATRLMKALIARARKKGLTRLVGTVLRTNQAMLRFSQALGFTVRDDPEDPEQVDVELALR